MPCLLFRTHLVYRAMTLKRSDFDVIATGMVAQPTSRHGLIHQNNQECVFLLRVYRWPYWTGSYYAVLAGQDAIMKESYCLLASDLPSTPVCITVRLYLYIHASYNREATIWAKLKHKPFKWASDTAILYQGKVSSSYTAPCRSTIYRVVYLHEYQNDIHAYQSIIFINWYN